MRFLLIQKDIIAGSGEVAEGVEFSDGSVVLRWLVTASTRAGIKAMTEIHQDIGSVMIMHGHDGERTLFWLDSQRRAQG